MSNHLAIATITAALGQLVHTSAETAVGGVLLQLGRPAPASAGDPPRRVFVYLFQVSPNAALRNTDLPGRDATGRLSQRPVVALDLHYLISFLGDERTLEAQRMLGAVARDLHARPLLGADTIQSVIAGEPALTDSNLAQAFERVRFFPVTLPLEEMSKLWSVLLQTPHMLSLVYQANVVLIDGLETAPAPLPVLRRGPEDQGVDTRLGPFPELRSFWFGTSAAVARRPRLPSLPNAELGLRLVIGGSSLGGDSVEVRFAHQRELLPSVVVTVTPAERSPAELNVDLPGTADPGRNAWAAGMYGVSVRVVGSGAERSSNALPLALAPRIVSIAPNPAPRDADRSVTLDIGCRPRVLPQQRASLLFEGREIPAEPHDVATESLRFVIADAPLADRVLLRLRVDDVYSQPFVFDAASGLFNFDDTQRVTFT